MTLKDKNGNAIGTTTTDASGHYQFKGLENGSYTVEFETPSGYTPTKANSGQDITVDSNGITTTGIINGADNLTIDSGFYKHQNIVSEIMYGKIQIKMVSKMTMKKEFLVLK